MTKLPKWRLLTSQRWNCLNLAVRNKGQRKLKHFTTASEIKSYQEHLEKNKPPEMVAQHACNKPASWPFNVKPSVAKKDLLSQSLEWYMHCVVLVTFEREPRK